MSIYKLIKISIFLVTGILVACSPDSHESKSSPVSSHSQTKGLKVFIDPKTGEFLSRPPKTSKSTVTSNGVIVNNAQSTAQYSELKESTVPGGGTYIELVNPPLKGKVFKQRNQ